MPESSPRPEERRTLLSKIHRMSLDRLSDADVSSIAEKVVETRLNQARITAAKFSSFI